MINIDKSTKQKVKDFLISRNCIGKSKAMTAGQIKFWTGINERSIREAISELRIEDQDPIASLANGFFYPETEEEAEHCLNQLHSRLVEQYKSYRGFRSGVRKRFPGGQIQLSLEEIA